MRAALGFLTPLGGARTPSPRALPWFAVVGALIGLGVGGAWWVGTEVWSPAVGAALAIVTDLVLTGMLHHDGLGDSADGLLPHLSRERRLEVMRQPDIGAFGVAAIGSVLLLQFAALSSMHVDVLLVVGAYASSRCLAAGTITTMPYARPGGLAEAFRGPATRSMLVVALAVGVLAAAIADVAVLAGYAGFGAVVLLARRQLGGYTGDVLGAAIVVAQTCVLLMAAA
jgi:adenosylcobinamide-GDP ribazoletransferase